MRSTALLLFAACSVERTALLATVEAPPLSRPAILATGFSRPWHDANYFHWSIWVCWQEVEGAAPGHTEYTACRAPWGGSLTIDECVRATTAAVVERHQRRLGLPRAVWGSVSWTGGTDGPKAWWWGGDPAVEPLLRVPALGAPETL